MNKSILWRAILVLVIILGWTLSMVPLTDRPFLPQLRSYVKADKAADLDKLIESSQKRLDAAEAARAAGGGAESLVIFSIEDAIEQTANAEGILLRDLVTTPKGETASNKQVVTFVRNRGRGKMRLGLDLRGGTEFLVGFDKAELRSTDSASDTVDQIIEILRNRLDSLGTLGAEIKPLDDQTISIKIPSVKLDDVARFRKLIEQSAKLQFYMVNPDRSAAMSAEAPEGYIFLPYVYDQNGREITSRMLVKSVPEPLTGSHLTRARADLDQMGKYVVSITFDAEGAKLFLDLTGPEHHDQQMAIVLDGQIKSAPSINEPIAGGSAQITGSFTLEEAKQLAVVLASGSLPVPIKIQSENTTNPTLGLETIKSGALACVLGMALVFIFMIVYYRIPGVIANIALLLNAVLVLGTLPLLDASLTLPGIAGLVLTIGMAVDSNVLIYERIREELESGKSLQTAIRNGYDKVFSAIFDSNITTLFTAFFLYKFGSGPLRGFAITLSVGLIASMFTALFVTRLIFDFLIEKDLISTPRLMHIFKQPHIDFMGKAKTFGMISALAVLLALGASLWRGKSAFAVDFVGGTQLNLTYHSEGAAVPPTASEVQKAVSASYDSPVVTFKTSAIQSTRLLEIVLKNDAALNAAPNADDTETISTNVVQILNKSFPGVTFEPGTTNQIGALVGKRFTKQAAMAVCLSLLVLLLYVSFRFEFGYALGATICLAHDAIIATGLFLIAGRHIDLNAIAAILTLIGYSLNDTIVIFDRIRENIGLNPNEKFAKVVNDSINQTLSRTVLTSLLTLFVVIALYIFGGGAINDFAFIMLVGIVVGTYSTIFIASPIMYLWHNYRQNMRPADAKSSTTVGAAS